MSHSHHDLEPASSYPVRDVTLPLFPPERVDDGSLQVVCPGCLESYRAARPPAGEVANYRCATDGCSSVIRVVGDECE